MTDIPDYIRDRIRKPPPLAAHVVPGSTPVVAFGNLRDSRVATLSWNPSKLEFLARDGNELVGDKRRLETLASLEESDLASLSAAAVCSVFCACNNYFHRRPYRRWFNPLEKILKHVDASYYNGSACHLDLVQWATDPVWSKLPPDKQNKQNTLIKADLPFLKEQLSQKKLRLLLLNGPGIMKAYKERLGGEPTELPLLGSGRLRFYTGCYRQGLRVVGWSINLQGQWASNEEIESIGAAVAKANKRCNDVKASKGRKT